ncbi:hypothetical protein BJX70DRAFT_406036 [Aspergillus crustosus]
MAPRISIIGGGPGGLTLGRLLHSHAIPFKIYDLRKEPTEADLSLPSGMLDLHEESGLAALRACGLYDKFLQRKAECSEAQKVADRDGEILYRDEGELSERPEISRDALTRLLAEGLPGGCIVWDRKLRSAEVSSSSSLSEETEKEKEKEKDKVEIELDFGPHGKETCDLVIGADGAWSRVRDLLTDTKPHYAGTQSITATITDITSRYPHLAEFVGQGSFSALGMRHGVMSQRGPRDSARIYVFLSLPDEHFASSSSSSVDRADTAAAAITKERLLTDESLLGQWGARVKELVSVAIDEEISNANNDINPADSNEIPIRPLYTLPIGTSWPPHSNATLVGDAAHLMCPWAGEGVNLAMWDALLLSEAISTAYEATKNDPGSYSFIRELNPRLAQFEVDLVARAKEKAEETYGNGQMMFGEDGAKAFTEFFLSAYGEGVNE